MTLDEMKGLILQAMENPSQSGAVLIKLQDGIAAMDAQLIEANTKVEQQQKDIETLNRTNHELFLRIPQNTDPAQNTDPVEDDPTPEESLQKFMIESYGQEAVDYVEANTGI